MSVRKPNTGVNSTAERDGGQSRIFGPVKPNFKPKPNPPQIVPTTTTRLITTTTTTTTSQSLSSSSHFEITTSSPFISGNEYSSVSNAGMLSLQPTNSSMRTFFPPASEITSELCAPFPPCHPLGCGPGIAPIDCPDCNSAATAFTLFGMCLLAIVIVFTNVLVIVVISRNETLRRRHGYIKISLAVADLLIGLLVVPAAVFNLATTLYLPTPSSPLVAEGRAFFRPVYQQDPAAEFAQKNSLASVFFGTILIISFTASIYNLLLLSADRLIAVAKPMQSKVGRCLSNRRLTYCVLAVWFLGLLLSSLPALIPSRFSYQLDGTTFLFLQTVNIDSDFGAVSVAVFSSIVLGVPYIATLALNAVTLGLTIKKLKFSRKHSSRRPRSDPSKRMQLLRQKFPEMTLEQSEESNARPNSIWQRIKNNFFKNTKAERSQPQTKTNQSRSRKSIQRSAKELNTRVTKMITTMVLAFSICLCPFIAVNIALATGSLNCSNVGPGYNFAVYLSLLNSALNFFIYNLWHKEFRMKLIDSLKREPASSQSQKPSAPSSIVATTSSNGKAARYNAGPSAFARRTASHYHMMRKKKTNSARSQQVFEQESHF